MKNILHDVNIFFITLSFTGLSLVGCGNNLGGVAAHDSNLLPEASDVGFSGSANLSADKPLALIYKGPGSCSLEQGDAGESGYGCSEASADVAVAAGFRYQFVGPQELNSTSSAAQVAALFGPAKVWVQPGGVSNTAYYAMSSKLKSELIKFVQNGGGFVGYCAGAFLATDWFNIFPGSSALYGYSSARSDVHYAFLNVTWSGQARKVYFEGGPYLYNLGSTAEVMGTFSSGAVAAARASYGKGRVYISGPHPEAPQVWSNEDDLTDPDGGDHDLAVGMMSWAAGGN